MTTHYLIIAELVIIMLLLAHIVFILDPAIDRLKKRNSELLRELNSDHLDLHSMSLANPYCRGERH